MRQPPLPVPLGTCWAPQRDIGYGREIQEIKLKRGSQLRGDELGNLGLVLLEAVAVRQDFLATGSDRRSVR